MCDDKREYIFSSVDAKNLLEPILRQISVTQKILAPYVNVQI